MSQLTQALTDALGAAQGLEADFAAEQVKREARPDGVLETRINGVKTDSRTGYRGRRHPGMGIGGVNANYYLGGVPTTKAMTWATNNMALAREYIGPRTKA